jgi:tetratricopeptide (TPR) repeat protein
VPDFHSLHWLLYGTLQLGRADEAPALLATMHENLAKVPKDDLRNQVYGTFIRATMAATILVETKAWDKAAELLGPGATGAVPQVGSDGNPYQDFAVLAQAPAVFARGFAAAMTGSGDAQQAITTLQRIRQQVADAPVAFAAEMAPVLEIQALEISAARSAHKGRIEEAIATMQQATALEEALPVPPGPPPLIKPSHEFLGELFLRAGRPEEAARAFETALFRHPGRRQSVLGKAEAAKLTAP